MRTRAARSFELPTAVSVSVQPMPTVTGKHTIASTEGIGARNLVRYRTLFWKDDLHSAHTSLEPVTKADAARDYAEEPSTQEINVACCTWLITMLWLSISNLASSCTSRSVS